MDFEKMYRADTPPPWEIGGPQPALAAVLKAGEPRGPRALDLGCGTGDLAIALARLGFQVTGVDFSPTAVDQARAKAAAEGLTVEFEVADATRLRLTKRFDSIFDSGLLHSLVRTGADYPSYIGKLPLISAPGATLFVLAVSRANDDGWGVTADFLRASFPGPSWVGVSIDEIGIAALQEGEPLTLSGFLLRATTPHLYAGS
ncbi:class I SAM-dependent methyltransferase [Actinoplanes sp. NPDC023714]|uniref:class I SAM-dependent methyltransferase n=1 Tax=Actinoplanes sp. NPDC023714 TaxID=3154322 RepID=UPI0033F82419